MRWLFLVKFLRLKHVPSVMSLSSPLPILVVLALDVTQGVWSSSNVPKVGRLVGIMYRALPYSNADVRMWA